jgi:hypothetical protein
MLDGQVIVVFETLDGEDIRNSVSVFFAGLFTPWPAPMYPDNDCESN